MEISNTSSYTASTRLYRREIPAVYQKGTFIDSSSNELNACSLVYLAQHKPTVSGRVKRGFVYCVYIMHSQMKRETRL